MNKLKRPIFLLLLFLLPALPVALLRTLWFTATDVREMSTAMAAGALMLYAAVCAFGSRDRQRAPGAALWILAALHALVSAWEIWWMRAGEARGAVGFASFLLGTYAYAPVGVSLAVAFFDALALLGLAIMLFARGGRTARELGRHLMLGAGIGLVPVIALGALEGSVYLVKNAMLGLSVATACAALGLMARAAVDALRERAGRSGPSPEPAPLEAPPAGEPGAAASPLETQDPGSAAPPEPTAPDALPAAAEATAPRPSPWPALEPTKPARRRPAFYNPVLVALAAIVLPLGGLALNHALGNMLGYRPILAFYLIALINGILMLPLFRRLRPKLPFLFLKAAGFCYICYFAVTFLPYMPVGLLGLLAVVPGLLLLAPAIVFTLEILQLREDVRALNGRTPKAAVAAALAAGFLLLPLLFTGDALIDRANFQTAVDQVAEADAPRRMDSARLARTLSDMNRFALSARSSGVGMIVGDTGEAAILSDAYRALAYGGRVLDRPTVEKLYQRYYAEATEGLEPDLSSWGITQPGFRLRSVTARTSYDEATGLYESWVDLEVQNVLEQATRQYEVKFSFPKDCFVTDYYLDVNGQRKTGLISERSAAAAAYQKVVSRALDPGLLEYEGDATLRLRVFPFSGGEVRRTGFKVLHPGDLNLSIGGRTLSVEADRGAYAPGDLGEHETCGANCKTLLPYGVSAYENARALFHNARPVVNDGDTITEALRQRILTNETAFIVLETREQEEDLLRHQQEVLDGKASPRQMASMDESVGPVAIAALAAALLVWRRRWAFGRRKRA